MFATSGPVVELWNQLRSEPMRTMNWGVDTVNCVKFNPVEVNMLASTSDDRHITLYDVRDATPVRKLIMEMRSNRLCWNPMEAFNFTVANEDHNLYTFDMRNLEQALNVHKDHVSAVMDIDYSPTGKEFVSASYDCTLRIFAYDGGHSREVYHTKRMQRLSAVKWSADNKYILSASDEMSIRLWKSTAWEQLGTKAPRQRAATEYADKLKDKFKYHPEIKRISRWVCGGGGGCVGVWVGVGVGVCGWVCCCSVS
jgi:WD repeat and SOF domain-containing protein 1